MIPLTTDLYNLTKKLVSDCICYVGYRSAEYVFNIRQLLLSLLVHCRYVTLFWPIMFQQMNMSVVEVVSRVLVAILKFLLGRRVSILI
jgi:hypothetical protein